MLAPFPALAALGRADGEHGCIVRVSGGATVAVRSIDSRGGGGVRVPAGCRLSVLGSEGGEGGEGGTATLDGGGLSRLFLVESDANLTLTGPLTLANGRSTLAGGGAVLLLPRAALEATGVTFSRNRAVLGSGGAVAARGGSRLKLVHAKLKDNYASWRGGALSLTGEVPPRTDSTEMTVDILLTYFSHISLGEYSLDRMTAGTLFKIGAPRSRFT